MDRSVPPSRGRLSAAAQRGHYPSSRLLTTGAVLIGLGSACILAGPALWRQLIQRISERLSSLSTVQPAEALAFEQFTRFIPLLLQCLLAIAIPAAAVWILPALIFRSRTGHTAVPIPASISRGVPFWTTGALTAILAVLVFIYNLIPLSSLFSMPIAGPFVLSNGIVAGGRILLQTGLILALGGVIQLSLYKAAIFQQLSLTRDDAEKEQRLHEAHPLVRSRIRTDGQPR